MSDLGDRKIILARDAECDEVQVVQSGIPGIVEQGEVTLQTRDLLRRPALTGPTLGLFA